jgi:Spy/CpxP family protein refolding chaperone
MTRRLALVVALLAALCSLADSAEARKKRDGGVIGGAFRPPAFLSQLFRPELIMRNQAAIGLTPEQRTAITDAIRDTQERLMPLQWELEAKSEEATKVFAAPQVDADAAMAAAAPVMALEERIKTEHLRLLITIKNELTPEQQAKLRELHPEGCGPRRR